jgi:anti-sigma factor RsiW
MTNPMTHDDFNAQLMAFLEGDTDDATHAAVEKHAQQCAKCGALLADLRAMRVESAKLPELTPSRDLWAGIASRIEAQVVPIGSVSGEMPAARVETPVRAAGITSRRWVRGSLAAAALLTAVGLGYVSGATRTGPAAVQTVASADTGALAPSDSVLSVAVTADSLTIDSTQVSAGAMGPGAVAAQLAVATLAADYDREIVALRKLVDERRNQLDPVTVAVIEKNLKVIDIAITESRKAIARDPASRFLIESLNQSLVSKVELLRIAAALPNRT